ncbi:MAG: hypothetical protein Q4A71_05995 [Actinomycetaceae bacterium]|nr:hypothetical protein [Actinomycetaceae bacterium]
MPHNLESALGYAQKISLAIAGLCTVCGAVTGYFVAGETGLWGAIAGGVLGIVMVVITQLTNKLGLNHPDYVAGAVLGRFLLKIMILMLAIYVTKNVGWLNQKAVLCTLLLIVVLTVGSEALAIHKTKVITVESGQNY